MDAPVGQAIGIKEAIAMELERWGDTRVAEVTEVPQEQMKIEYG